MDTTVGWICEGKHRQRAAISAPARAESATAASARAHFPKHTQTVSALFPLGVLGMDDSLHPAHSKTYKLPTIPMAARDRNRPVRAQLSGSNLSGRILGK